MLSGSVDGGQLRLWPEHDENERKSFAWIDGEPWLIVSFTVPPDDHITLQKQLAQVIRQHAEHDILIVRRLTRSELSVVREHQQGADVEAWALLNP